MVDRDNNVVGTTDVETAHAQKQLHRVVGVFLFDSNDNVLLQEKNDHQKYDLSVGGHVKQGETYDAAAQRELREELGLQIPLTHLSTFLPVNTKLGHFWALYQGELPADWEFSSTNEVQSVIKMSVQAIIQKIKVSPELFTHGFLNAFAEFNRIKIRGRN